MKMSQMWYNIFLTTYNEQEEIIIRKVMLTMNEQLKYEVIKSLADHPDGNKDRAALTLGCTRRHINRMLFVHP